MAEVPPNICGNCGSLSVTTHCKSPNCIWIRCHSCGFVTGVVAGKPKAIPGKGS